MEFLFKDTSWLKLLVLYYTLLSLLPPLIRCLSCYQCSNIINTPGCHHTVVCGNDELCFTDTFGYGDETRFNMGCRNLSVCTGQTTTPSLSIIGRSTSHSLECSQCCGVDSCNKYLCATGTHALTQNGACHDDPEFDCATISSVFNVCGEKEHAKLVCRKFCGLCAVVDGGWSSWGMWTNCDTSCGNGTISRTRACDNPTPQHGGLPCIGLNKNTKACNLRPCPVDGGWSTWSSWNTCSISCGIGTQIRTRECSNPSPSFEGLQCSGSVIDFKACFPRPCTDGVWSSWSSWSPCSQSCQGGLSTRQRQCDNPAPSTFGHDCVGNSMEVKLCNSILCQGQPVNGGWTSWSDWSTCPVSCGVGLETRTRSCTNPPPANFGQSCIGNSEDKKICNTNACPVTITKYTTPGQPVNGGWTSWSNWSTCSVSCGGGLKTRIRSCTNPSPANHGRSCIGDSADARNCSMDINCAGLSVRLQGGSNPRNGRLEASFDGIKWGTVCDDYFDDKAAGVVCRMLGLTAVAGGYCGTVSSAYGPGSGEILLDDVICSGNESSLLQCMHKPIKEGNCAHKEDVGVVCH